ncbi:hypothetical protein [Balneatrix alpica]|uniref:Uncharacterized protein n=1 Tax=Balneatrix alpica TaxID=75684 RepID=A0ABV5ZDG4_9GAMM|nr:hypothetical protein [Balneatrix alpica]
MTASADIRKRDRIIEELRTFIKKVLTEPEIAAKSVAIARELLNEENADRKIADRISATTSIKIPAEMSDADRLYLELLREVVRDEKALY